MRRSAAIASILALTASGLVAAASSAAAATSSLTVTALGRDHKPVPKVDIQAVNTHDTFTRYEFTSGHARKLPAGTYDVIADIYNDRDGTDSLIARRIKISGATDATLKAASGKPLAVSLTPSPQGLRQQITMGLCVAGSTASTWGVADPGKVFLVPSTLKSIEFAYESSWLPTEPMSHDDRYVVTGQRAGIPNGLSVNRQAAALANVAVSGRSGTQTGRVRLDASQYTDACADGTHQYTPDLTLPYSFHLHVTPGDWLVAQHGISDRYGDYVDPGHRTFRGGHSYSVSFGRAVYGPGTHAVPSVAHGVLNFDPGNIVDPHSQSQGIHTKGTDTLTLAGRPVSRNDGTVRLARAGWYTLSEQAARSRDHATMSPRTAVRMRFHADPAVSEVVRVFATRFAPTGLNSSNQARAHSNTSIALSFLRPAGNAERSSPADSVKTVHVWASYDGGKTWHAVKLTHTKKGWTANVHNPASGYVSLRAQLNDTSGSSSVTRIVNAYGIK